MGFLFEFMDQPWLPASLHATLREVVEFHHEVTLSYYYDWAAQETLKRTEIEGIEQVIEMGAGSGGFSQALAARVREEKQSLHIEICDLRPDPDRYRELEMRFPGILRARKEPIDLRDWVPPPGPALVVMSAAFHHISPRMRNRVLASLIKQPTQIFESVSRGLLPMIGCALGWLPGLLTPFYFLGIAGRWRRFLWCWLIPVAPLMVAFDGVISCARCWTEEEWRSELARVGVNDSMLSVKRRGFSQMISW